MEQLDHNKKTAFEEFIEARDKAERVYRDCLEKAVKAGVPITAESWTRLLEIDWDTYNRLHQTKLKF